jgi:hypothetical protein
VDTTREELNEPPPPVVLGQPPQPLGATVATNLLTALQALSDSQNNLMSAWLQHYDERIQLGIDLGVLRLDERGMWIEEPIDQSLAQLEQMYPLPPELPVDWLKDAGLTPPALYPNEGVPPLGGTTSQVQAEAATPETPRPRLDTPRPEEPADARAGAPAATHSRSDGRGRPRHDREAETEGLVVAVQETRHRREIQTGQGARRRGVVHGIAGFLRVEVLGLGSWVLGLGSWVLGLGSWVLGLGIQRTQLLMLRSVCPEGGKRTHRAPWADESAT